MKFVKTKFEGAFLIELEALEDLRGFFARSFCKREFDKLGLNSKIAQCNLSFNKKKGTIRGMHYQVAAFSETKIVSVIKGAIWDVIVDVRESSPTYLQWEGFEISSENHHSLYIPEGFAHGFQTLENDTTVYYQIGNFYEPGAARGLLYNDPKLDIKWKALPVTISEKDLSYPEIRLDQ